MAFLERVWPWPTSARLYDSLEEYATPRVIEAMRQVPRRRFVQPIHYLQAYKDKVLPLPFGGRRGELATISQPRVVALMTTLLDPQPTDCVLEIGTASGYQAAVLGKLASKVVSVEIIPELARKAKKRIRKLGIENVEVALADGSIPFARKEAFDRILVTASLVPHPQAFELSAYSLKDGGTFVAPIGGKYGERNYGDLVKIRKTGDGLDVEETIDDFSFVLMHGRAGWDVFLRGYIDFMHKEFFAKDKKAEEAP